MTTDTPRTIAQPYETFYLGKKDATLHDEMIEIATVHVGYKALLFRSEAGSSWRQIKLYATRHDCLVHAVTTELTKSLTCEAFEAEWLSPSQHQLRRDPLTDRKLTGWYDDEGYAFTQSSQGCHKPASQTLSGPERAERTREDIALIKTHQAERQLAREEALKVTTEKRRRGRKRRSQ